MRSMSTSTALVVMVIAASPAAAQLIAAKNQIWDQGSAFSAVASWEAGDLLGSSLVAGDFKLQGARPEGPTHTYPSRIQGLA